MTTTAYPEPVIQPAAGDDIADATAAQARPSSEGVWARAVHSRRVLFGGGLLLLILLVCLVTLVLTLRAPQEPTDVREKNNTSLYYDLQRSGVSRTPPKA